jgi:hypothetical protein
MLCREVMRERSRNWEVGAQRQNRTADTGIFKAHVENNIVKNQGFVALVYTLLYSFLAHFCRIPRSKVYSGEP